MFREFLDRCWTDHGDDPQAVYARLPEGLALATEPGHRAALAALVVHVAGEHLGRWDEGLALLERIAAPMDPDGTDARAVGRSRAALLWCAGRRDEAEVTLQGALDPARPAGSSRARVLAVAAAALAGQGRFAEAEEALKGAVDAAAYGPGADDPAARSLAVTGNNLAAALEERTDRDAAATALMKQAARLGRTWWEVAGDWRNVVLAEVRLAFTHLAAGEPEVALEHARAGLALADGNAAGPDERLAPLVLVARARAATGDPRTAEALAEARAALAQAGPQLREWYAPLLPAD